MEIIYMDNERVEKGVIKDFSFDMDIGENNDFEIMTSSVNHIMDYDYSFYVEGTEYGGIVDSIKSDTKRAVVYYKGRSWRGILASKIIIPNEGEDYLVVNGEVSEIIDYMLARAGLDGLFKSKSSDFRVDIRNHRFNRYTDLLSGLNRMLAPVGAKLVIRYDEHVSVSAERIKDMSDILEVSEDAKLHFIAESKRNQVNHLICLGRGELSEREVIHLYTNDKRDIVKNKFYTGVEEVVSVYDNSNVESYEELETGGIARLRELMDSDIISVNVDNISLELGDIVRGQEKITGLTVDRPIIQKIVRISDYETKIEYKVGG